jgi:ubiquinone/menaquinone biosynthesis C-methylase UbiE
MSEPAATLKAEVKAFWNRQSCDTEHALAGKFSRQYFDEIERRRYTNIANIHSFAQFARYHGKRVLEVGFGAGTDFMQWLRAGAVASGVDLTEEALANLTRGIEVYGLPKPEKLQVADAENLPFADGSFDLGYSWGVLHHTPNTERAIAELVRVVRAGGEIKIMLYNRHSYYMYGVWLHQALRRGQPWRSLRWLLWNRIESMGTKGYTQKELRQILAPLGLTDVRIETVLTTVDFSERKPLPFRIWNALLRAFDALVGGRFGWNHCVCARKRWTACP